MKTFYSLPVLFTTALLLSTAAHAQATTSAGSMSADDGYSVSAPSDAPSSPTANDGNAANDVPPVVQQSDGTVDSSAVEKPNPEKDLAGTNYGNSLDHGTIQNNPTSADLKDDLDNAQAKDTLNQPNRTVTLNNGTVSGDVAVTPVPPTHGALGTSAGAVNSGAMGNTSGGSAGSAVGHGAFGK